jgi:hypothetical protein
LFFEIVQQRVRVLTNVTKIYRLTAFGEEEKAVKFLKDDGAWLVDSAENGLAIVRQLSQEGTNCPRALRI